MLYDSFKRQYKIKKQHSENILGCDLDFFVSYLLETYKNNYKAGKFKILGHSHTIETKDKLSEIRSKYLEKCPNGFPDVGWYKIQNVNGEEFTVRGTWERDFGNYLTFHKILWIRNVYLKYIKSDGSIHRYNPDFYLTEYDIYLEHFCINKNGRCPQLSEWEELNYLDTIKWKRKLHVIKNTKLLESKQKELPEPKETIIDYKDTEYYDYDEDLDNKKDDDLVL